MYRKVLKNVFVIVFLSFGLLFSSYAIIGIVVIDLCGHCKVQEENTKVIKINLVEKNNNQNISIAIYDKSGKLIMSKMINNSYQYSVAFQVPQGSYKVALANIKTGEKEIQYINNNPSMSSFNLF